MNGPKQRNLFADEVLPPEPMPWETAAESDRMAAQIVFNKPLETVYHYLVPDELRTLIEPGQRVRVPFGRGDRPTTGFCVGLGAPPKTRRALKTIESIIDREPLLSAEMLTLTRWIADEYLCGWGQVLETAVPAGVKKKAGTRIVSFFQAADGVGSKLPDLKLSPKQRAVLEVLCEGDKPLPVGELTEIVGCGTGPINALRKKGLIRAVRRRTDRFAADVGPIPREDDLKLNRDQQRVLKPILAQLRSGGQRTFLLHGVTGSGKTEVYIQAIREVVSYGRQAIVLVPEISLTPQTIRRFRSRFDSVAVLHSHQSDAQRHWYWQQIARGDVQVVIGARSAVFAPTPHLGMIIIDEEHEPTFKQETTPRYHARDVARQRTLIEKIPLVLGSATPMLESWQRTKETEENKNNEHKDVLLSMPSRVEGRPLPPVVLVDIRNDPRYAQGQSIGRALESAIRVALGDDGQVILFLNLRGFSPILWCRACSKPVKCLHCDVSMTWHKESGVMLCHSCDYQGRRPTNCPQCGHASLHHLGAGTQRLEQEVRARFSPAQCMRMDSDSMRKPGSHDKVLEAFRRGDFQILLGTQMIAKGLDFPNVTLVGVIDADSMLNQPDLRAAERTFQLISQVAGRTGRSARGGRVFVQTASPTEPAIRKAAEHDYAGFAAVELAHRLSRGVPPFRRMIRIILRGPEKSALNDYAKKVSGSLREAIGSETGGVRILGPAPAPIAKLKGLFRIHFQLFAEDPTALQRIWHATAAALPAAGQVEIAVDVDPLNLR